MRVDQLRRGRPSADDKEWALWLTFGLGHPLQSSASITGYTVPAVRAWVVNFWRSGGKCAVFNCWRDAENHECVLHHGCRRDSGKNRFMGSAAWRLGRLWFIG